MKPTIYLSDDCSIQAPAGAVGYRGEIVEFEGAPAYVIYNNSATPSYVKVLSRNGVEELVGFEASKHIRAMYGSIHVLEDNNRGFDEWFYRNTGICAGGAIRDSYSCTLLSCIHIRIRHDVRLHDRFVEGLQLGGASYVQWLQMPLYSEYETIVARVSTAPYYALDPMYARFGDVNVGSNICDGLPRLDWFQFGVLSALSRSTADTDVRAAIASITINNPRKIASDILARVTGLSRIMSSILREYLENMRSLDDAFIESIDFSPNDVKSWFSDLIIKIATYIADGVLLHMNDTLDVTKPIPVDRMKSLGKMIALSDYNHNRASYPDPVEMDSMRLVKQLSRPFLTLKCVPDKYRPHMLTDRMSIYKAGKRNQWCVASRMLSETKHNGYREGYFLYSDVLCQVNFNVKHKRFRVAEVRAAQNKITRLSKFIEKLAIAEVDKANEFLASRSDYSLDSIMVDENPYSTMRRCLPDDNVPISEKLLVNNITFIGCGSFVECRTAIEKAIIQSTDEDIAMYISKCVAKMQPAFGGEFVRSAADAAGAASGISPEDILDLVELPANNLTES